LLSDLPIAVRLLLLTIEIIAAVVQFDGKLSGGLELVAEEMQTAVL